RDAKAPAPEVARRIPGDREHGLERVPGAGDRNRARAVGGDPQADGGRARVDLSRGAGLLAAMKGGSSPRRSPSGARAADLARDGPQEVERDERERNALERERDGQQRAGAAVAGEDQRQSDHREGDRRGPGAGG